MPKPRQTPGGKYHPNNKIMMNLCKIFLGALGLTALGIVTSPIWAKTSPGTHPKVGPWSYNADIYSKPLPHNSGFSSRSAAETYGMSRLRNAWQSDTGWEICKIRISQRGVFIKDLDSLGIETLGHAENIISITYTGSDRDKPCKNKASIGIHIWHQRTVHCPAAYTPNERTKRCDFRSEATVRHDKIPSRP